ncbi:MAG: 16S rRNA (uracil(1498)-N(3))-methyltransferase, partial [Clostridia bacterium]|nr:16S rRNA (uracil(1498)-N(3))-methyltransferase [Clostridia bacterium]
MPRFFVSAEQISDNVVTLTGDDAHHIARSLRMAAGEFITVCDDRAIEYECRLTSFEQDKRVLAEIVSSAPCATEPPFDACLFQALPKGEKFDSIIQKAVECGVYEIVPFQSSRCIAKAKADGEAEKTKRRCRIAAEAAKQSGRGRVPAVKPTVSFEQMLALTEECDLCLFCYEGEGTQTLASILQNEQGLPARPRIAVIVGSEGGFSPEDAARAEAAGMKMTGLGKRILRTETAAPFVLSCL